MKDTCDFDGNDEFYGACGDYEKHGVRIRNDLKIEMAGRDEISDTYGKEKKEWQGSHAKYGKLGEELDRQIGLIIGFE